MTIEKRKQILEHDNHALEIARRYLESTDSQTGNRAMVDNIVAQCDGMRAVMIAMWKELYYDIDRLVGQTYLTDRDRASMVNKKELLKSVEFFLPGLKKEIERDKE